MVETRQTGPPRLAIAQQDIKSDHKRRGPAGTRKITPRTAPWRSYSYIDEAKEVEKTD